jgi:hypothetical protein
MSETYPATSCEASLADVVSNIEFDAKKIAEYMRSIGFTDEQIMATTITAEDYKKHMDEWGLPENHDYRALGHALLDTMKVVLLPGAMSSAANLCHEKNTYGPVDGVKTPQQFNKAASRKYSRVIAHELLHLKKDTDENTRSSEETIRSLVELGPEADAIYQNYEKDPHEAHCREAESNAPEDLVRISYKEQPVVRKKIKRLRKRNSRVISRM